MQQSMESVSCCSVFGTGAVVADRLIFQRTAPAESHCWRVLPERLRRVNSAPQGSWREACAGWGRAFRQGEKAGAAGRRERWHAEYPPSICAATDVGPSTSQTE